MLIPLPGKVDGEVGKLTRGADGLNLFTMQPVQSHFRVMGDYTSWDDKISELSYHRLEVGDCYGADQPSGWMSPWILGGLVNRAGESFDNAHHILLFC